MPRVWKQEYLPLEKGGTWIADEDRLEAAKLYFSPYDLDASAAKKRSTYWIGYKVHFTETCDEDLPRLLTQVSTTIAPTPDRHALPDIHALLDQRDLLAEHHLVDAGYMKRFDHQYLYEDEPESNYYRIKMLKMMDIYKV